MRKIALLLFLAAITITCNAQIYYGGSKLASSRIMGKNFSVTIKSFKKHKTIEGTTSGFQIQEKKPTFKFLFGKQDDSTFLDKKNMEDILLLKLHLKKKNPTSRQLVVGKYGPTGVENGVNEEDVIGISMEETSENKFVVRAKQEMEPGEYCFYYNGDAFTSMEVYDFTIVE